MTRVLVDSPSAVVEVAQLSSTQRQRYRYRAGQMKVPVELSDDRQREL